MKDTLSNKLLEQAIDQFALLPGIGRKSALKFVLHILKSSPEEVASFTRTIERLKSETKNCSLCNNISDDELCPICRDTARDASVLCVVESVKDIIAIEGTAQYRGMYHVLGGVISPMEGIGPRDLNIDQLLERVMTGSFKEVIFALSATIEGDTTAYYIFKKIPNRDIVEVSTIARGIAVGNELEYTDQLTLGRSISNRVKFTI